MGLYDDLKQVLEVIQKSDNIDLIKKKRHLISKNKQWI